jgi:hypothetical protein
MSNSYLHSLGIALGTQLDWDSDGQCCLEFEDGIEITLSLHETLISMRSLLGEGTEPNLRSALTSQYRDPHPGYSLALDDSSNQLFLMTILDHENLEYIPELVYELLVITQEFKTHQTFSSAIQNNPQEGHSPPDSPNVMLA